MQDIDDFATQQAVQNVVILDDCGHCPMFEHPDTFNRELLAFLDAPAS
ncbi:MAG: alpha/beta hydrolase [Thermoleophilaceae bacterium]|nr:alpha/beta hydrolase [Thermoleophilaceae bacterium]